jgi:argininosuccinate lyase
VTSPGGQRPGKAWSGRFAEAADPTAEAFTASLAVDRRLWPHDLAGSEAWARALHRSGLLTAAELAALLDGLGAVRAELESGRFPFRQELEDIHMNVERRLIELAGPVAGKLHTGRSRNDQIALDERLYLRDVIARVDAGLRETQGALIRRAEEHVEHAMPGYTHLQRAQPVVLAHHLLAYVFMLARDRERFQEGAARVNVLPLGAGALAGTAFAIDREALARDLGFSATSPNSMDAVADRDFILEFLAAAAILGMHLSRLAADLTLWATSEFGFVEFSDAFATGSSIMPQKKNPDVAELIRGKTGRLYGNLTAVLVTMKGLPLTYNSDMQEDKAPLFDTIDTLEAILTVLPPMLGSLSFRLERMREAASASYSTATDLADYLSRKGLPFRDAHEVAARAVRHAIARGKPLEDLTLEELQPLSPLIAPDVHAAITLEASLRARAATGGTAPDAVRRQLATAREIAGPGRPVSERGAAPRGQR